MKRGKIYKEAAKLVDSTKIYDAKEALENAQKFFPQYMTPKIENIILRHMFPLNIKLPKYKEAWVITMIDKKVSLKIFKNPKGLLKYVGIRKDLKWWIF